VLCAGIHPLILKDSQIQVGDECETHTTSADEGLLSRTVDRIRPDIILLDPLQTIIWRPVVLCDRLSDNPGYSMGSRRKNESIPQGFLSPLEGTARGLLSSMSNDTDHRSPCTRERNDWDMNWNSADLPDVSARDPQIRCVRCGDTVRVAFMAWLEDGTLIDSSIGGKPPTFTVGDHSVMQGIERLVIGMRVGESKTEKIHPNSAFGPYSPELSCQVSRRWFQAQNIQSQVGLGLDVRKTDGTLVHMIITQVDDDHVTLDANHRLAGKDLLVQLDLLEILDQAGSSTQVTRTIETRQKMRSL